MTRIANKFTREELMYLRKILTGWPYDDVQQILAKLSLMLEALERQEKRAKKCQK